MKTFININRLDYMNPEYVVCQDRYDFLQQLYKVYCHETVDFIVQNNIQRRQFDNQQFSFVAIRIIFKDIWEWHIPQELESIIAKTGKQFFPASTKMDCLWMLKETYQDDIPVYFCDIMFFLIGPNAGELPKIDDKIDDPGEFIADSKILFSQPFPENSMPEIQALYFPDLQSSILQCEFTHDMTI